MLSDAIELYKSDYEFDKLAPNTKKQYNCYLGLINEQFRRLLILHLSDKENVLRIRIFIKSLIPETPRKAKYVLQVFKIFYHWAYRDGYIRHNRLDLLKIKFNDSSRLNNIWSEADVEFVMKNAPKSLQDFIFLALETGLRRCDLIKLKFTDIKMIDGHKVFIINQQKTGTRVTIPLSDRLIDWLDKNPPKTEFILNSADATPWHEDKFNHAWQRLKKRLNLTKITPHGLRKTAVTRLAKASCTVPEISAILGWSISSVQNMLDKHYFKDKLSVATSAIQKLNNSRIS